MWLLFVAYFTVYWFHVEWTVSASNLNHLQGTSNGSVSAQVQMPCCMCWLFGMVTCPMPFMIDMVESDQNIKLTEYV